jgi:hypothetical protein
MMRLRVDRSASWERSNHTPAGSRIYSHNLAITWLAPIDLLRKCRLQFITARLRQGAPGGFIDLKREETALPFDDAFTGRLPKKLSADRIFAGAQPHFGKGYADRVRAKAGLLDEVCAEAKA